MTRQRAIIIGAGPAGLTAALELVRRTEIQPIVLEASSALGGLSQTVNYKGNRMDIGGHRFFSKSDRVMQWWLELMPLERMPTEAGSGARAESGNGMAAVQIRYQGKERTVPLAGTTQQADGRVMLVRQRKSRIYFLRRFFDYPIQLTTQTLLNLGPMRTMLAGASYLRAALFPKRAEQTLEDFLVNRFGRQLYRMFFESYTEKVWGVPCRQISAEWGAQRIKGLSLRGVVTHFFKTRLRRRGSKDGGTAGGLAQKQTETSLIEQFLYPRLGPGQLWEHVAALVQDGGGEIHLDMRVDRVVVCGDRVTAIETLSANGERTSFAGDYAFSTMPVKELMRALSIAPPDAVMEVSDGLIYRDFITVGLLASKLAVREKDGSPLKDNWIYIQEPDVLVGRVQIFNNWSPAMAADPDTVWIGMEYFCYETDAIWKMADAELAALASEEIDRIGLLDRGEIRDAHVVRMPKTYPAYFGSYDRFDLVRSYTDSIKNLYLIGRNGMHKYNNQDHSMLTAMTAVDNIAAGIADKSNLWKINTEMEYNEEK
jgi:protoporphyrinogen oxidase